MSGAPRRHGARITPFGEAGIEREHVVFLRFFDKQCLKLLQFLRVLHGEVVGFAEIVFNVIKLPWSANKIALASDQIPWTPKRLHATQPSL